MAAVAAMRRSSSDSDNVGCVLDDAASFRFTWTIENFSKLTQKKLYSRVFVAGGCKWRLLVFPKGNNTNHLSVYLDVPDSETLPHGWRRKAKFSLAVVNEFNQLQTVRKVTEHRFSASECDFGFTSFIPLSQINDPNSGYLVNDMLIVETQVLVCSVLFYSKHVPENEFGEVVPELPEEMVEAPADEVPSLQEDAVNIEPSVELPIVAETLSATEPQNQAEVLQTASSTSNEEVNTSSSRMAVPSEPVNTLSSRMAVPSEPIQSYSNVQIKSRSLLAEISSRTRALISPLSGESSISSQGAGLDFLQEQKEALRYFRNMSLEDIQKANAFGNIERIILTLAPHTDNLLEKTFLEDFVPHLAEFKESIPTATTMIETAEAQRTSLSGKTKDLGERLVRKKKELSTIEAEFSKLSEEEEKIEAEIQLLIKQKEEILTSKKSVAIQMEKTNQEASEELEEFQSLEEEIKRANADLLRAKQKLELANVHWKLLKENLGLGKA